MKRYSSKENIAALYCYVYYICIDGNVDVIFHIFIDTDKL